MGKGRKERYIQISNTAVLDILRKYYEENEPEIKKSGYFFINNRGKRYTEQSIRLMLKKYTLKAGIQRKITPHMFRHSFATYLIEEGVDVSCVQQILGHSSIKTTQIYIHVAAKKQADILRELHPRNNMNIVKVAYGKSWQYSYISQLQKQVVFLLYKNLAKLSRNFKFFH